MANDYFQFKQFTIKQDRCAMKVGTDSVLLGAWVHTENTKNILDVGSGSGIIAIMLAQRINALIDAVEIEEQAYLQSLENFSESNWSNRIRGHHTDFKNFASTIAKKYDLIVSNPPYFVNSFKTRHVEVNLARHNDELPFTDLLSGVDCLLEAKGRFAVILPYVEGSIFITEAVKKGFFCIRKTIVKPKHHAPMKRLLMEFSRIPAPCEEDYLVINDEENDYTPKYRELTRDFYLFV
jgi:tRNA1Val (adenine37-N6)-methyltransferase